MPARIKTHALPRIDPTAGFGFRSINTNKPISQHSLNRALRQPRHQPPQKAIKAAVILVRRHRFKAPFHRLFICRPSHHLSRSFMTYDCHFVWSHATGPNRQGVWQFRVHSRVQQACNSGPAPSHPGNNFARKTHPDHHGHRHN